MVNALGGSLTGLAILSVIILLIWYLREKEAKAKTRAEILKVQN